MSPRLRSGLTELGEERPVNGRTAVAHVGPMETGSQVAIRREKAMQDAQRPVLVGSEDMGEAARASGPWPMSASA